MGQPKAVLCEGDVQLFCVDNRCALPCSEDVPCGFTPLPACTCCFDSRSSWPSAARVSRRSRRRLLQRRRRSKRETLSRHVKQSNSLFACEQGGRLFIMFSQVSPPDGQTQQSRSHSKAEA